jgi:hypothetical protein
MRLIGLAVILALGLALAPLATDAEQIGRVPKVGFSGALFSFRLSTRGCASWATRMGRTSSSSKYPGRVETRSCRFWLQS